MEKELKIGVIGLSRGRSFIKNAKLTGMKLVAVCDTWEEKLMSEDFGEDVARYTSYDEFLHHDMDAVILANYFHEHAPFAIKAMKQGKHVLSETMCNATLAEGVQLCRAVEETGYIYMLAENYPYTKFNQELRRIYESGELGKALYAEGEYNHPMAIREINEISPGATHWRNTKPPTYYCTHALAPLVYITDLLPTSVNALSIPAKELDHGTARISDRGFVILCRTREDAVFRLFGLTLPGHSNFYRLHGTKGAAEITRGPGYFGPQQVRVWHEEWDLPYEQPTERTYVPNWPANAELAEKAGHGGGDFWVEHYFAEAIRTGTQPFLDVYRGVTMSSVGILAWKSALQNGAPQAMPDFRDEAARKLVENDHFNPFAPKTGGEDDVYPSINGKYVPSEEDMKKARADWDRVGYRSTP